MTKSKALFLAGIIVPIAFFCAAGLVHSQVSEGEAKLVTEIEVRGNHSVSNVTLLSKIRTRVGLPYSEQAIDDDLKRLYLLGYFSDINIQAEPYQDGLKVIINVQERPVIEEINFKNFRRLRIKEEKLREAVTIRQGHFLDYPALAADARTLKDLYIKRGFAESSIEYRVELDEETKAATVNFIADEGRRMRIRSIAILGNDHFSDRQIRRVIKTKPAWIFGKGILIEDVLAEDMSRIKSFYRREGFSDAAVNYEIKEDPEIPYLHITINIEEGSRYLIGSVDFIGNTVFSGAELSGALEFTLPAQVYSEEGLAQDEFIIQGLYFDRGYINAYARAAAFFNPETEAIDVTYHLVENEIIYVDQIRIRGNTKTKDVVIRRELRLLPGDRFDGEKLRRSKERLVHLGFFEEVGFDTEPSPEAFSRDLVVEVREAKTGTFSFGGGYSTVDAFIGFIEIEQRNFDWRNFPYFTGAGQDLRLRAEMGTVSENYLLSFTEPWLFGYPVSFGFDAYRLSRKREQDIGWGYDETKSGGALRLGRELSEYLRGRAAYRYEQIKISNVDPLDLLLKEEEGRFNISKIETGLTFDKRDSPFDPTRGELLTGSFDIAGGFLGGDKDFYRVQLRASKYFPLFRKSVLEFRGRAGIVDAYGNSDSVPIYERFFAGGAYSIRGYEERTVGPIEDVSKNPLGGKSLLIGNIEYTYPLFDFLRVGCFYDVGNVWSRVGDIGSGGLKSGVGFGVQIKTPIGPIRLDYGIPLNKQPGEDKRKSGRIHFSMGSMF